MARDTLVVTACTLLSRLTGFVRVLVAAAVLSTGPLGDTYHAANMIPNLVFELVAGGILQAVLVPAFVAARRREGDAGLGLAAGAVSGVLLAVLAAIAAVVMALSPLITWALTALEDDAVLVADKRELITPMLLVFVPQILFYGIGMVTTAALAAKGRFTAAALAPAVNNLVVIGAYLTFRALRGDQPASLDLDTTEFLVLTVGTTLGVIAFTSVPGIVLAMQGVRWRPRWAPHDPLVHELRGSIGWAMLSVVGTLVPTGAAIVLGSGAAGGVAVFSVAFTFFVLPHALLAVPVATALAPRVADSWQRGQRQDTAALVERSMQVVLPLLAFAAAGMVALAWPIAHVIASIGQAGSQGPGPIAHAIVAFGFGLPGYGVAVIVLRVMFGLDQVKAAAQLVVASALTGVVVMAVASAAIADRDRATALAIGYGAAQTITALLITLQVRRQAGSPTWAHTGRLAVGSFVAAVAAALVMFVVQDRFEVSRTGAMAAIAVAAVAGAVVFGGLLMPVAGVRPTSLLRRGHHGA
jgi:putative peptidoglycan lipid II flippase